MICGVLAGIAGIIASSRIYSADVNNIGLNLEMDAILAVALGGNVLGGGKFSLMGSVIGAYTIQALTTTLYAMNVKADQLPVYKAIVVVIIVTLQSPVFQSFIAKQRAKKAAAAVEAACREANCDGFIRKMEKGYDTPTGENGNLLSGGERQRISIARAILKNSPILLLDEATASLDIENELAVKQAIANLLKEKKTVVMIAHTLSIVKNADQILVVADGRIAESGTHDELLTKGGKYAAMWNAEQKISA